VQRGDFPATDDRISQEIAEDAEKGIPPPLPKVSKLTGSVVGAPIEVHWENAE
jgi:hypothetical protein